MNPLTRRSHFPDVFVATLCLAAGQLQQRHQATCQYSTTAILNSFVELNQANGCITALWNKQQLRFFCLHSALTNDSLEEKRE